MNAENTQDDQGADDVVPYEQMHWATLKKLVEAESQEWVDVKTAVDFLNATDSFNAGEQDQDSGSDNEQNTGDEGEQDPPADGAGDDLNDVDGTDESADQSIEDDVVTGDDLVNAPEDDEADKDPCFDEKAPHGVISGISNARYWQNGCHFDSQKKYLAPEDVE